MSDTYTTTAGEVWRASPRVPHIVIAELRALRADRDAAVELLALKLAEIALLSIETEKLRAQRDELLAALEKIAECESVVAGDVVDIAQKAVKKAKGEA